ncbi:MAG: DNA mismatch repair endonuclease MutL [Chloroflexi bacterium]|nr:DNA mismatch repair endonuclease MutL [Chloroflexota bacterium]
MPIKILSPEVSAKIAAGEIIERPASVVKELVENSLDAGATQIKVEINGGGIKLIKISDNGTGIVSDDIEIAFARHATSKVSVADDLENISTLGFRGEALPSIAAVAEVEVISRTEGETAGISITLKNGSIIDKHKTGSLKGTTTTVRNLFHTVPARLKFLKSTETEISHISSVISQYSLAFPEVKFILNIEGKTSFNSPGNGNLRDVLISVYGSDTAREMVEVTGIVDASQPKVTGFISPKHIYRSNRNHLFFFVNRRSVKNSMLTFAVEEAYRDQLVAGKHPITVMNIEIPFSEVDVNVHPSKIEVKFKNEGLVFKAVQKAVREALVGSVFIPTLQRAFTPIELHGSRENLFGRYEKPAGREQAGVSHQSIEQNVLNVGLPILHVIGQLSKNFVIAEGPDGVYMIDQHAAHERILYEKIILEKEAKCLEVQGLLDMITVELTPAQEQLLLLHNDFLKSYGFELQGFGNRTYIIRSIPALIKSESITEIVIAILETFNEKMDDLENRMAISLACHGAIKAGQLLTMEEMRELIGQLEKATQPYTCPHGRPTIINLSFSQLQREFDRK